MKLSNWFGFGSSEERNLNNPRTPLSAPADWLWDALGTKKSATGLNVTPASSLETPAVWAAVRRISSTVATLPLHVYRHTNDGGKERAREHPSYHLLHTRPNPEMSSFVWRETMMSHLLLFGDHFSEIERNGRGDVVALWPILPFNVRSERAGDKKVYVVSVGAEQVALPPENVLHIPGFSLEGHGGLIPTQVARNAIGLSQALEQHGARYFANSATPSGILSHPGKLGSEAADRMRESWSKVHGGLSNSHRLAILEEGMSFSPLSLPNDVSQFLESRRFSVEEIARLFLIPPHLVGDMAHATFSNIEMQGIEYAIHCIEPWTRRIEGEISRLVTDRSHFAEFQLSGLLRGDSKARSEFYASALQNGWMSVNEVRALENLNPVEGGDTHFAPLNMGRLNGPAQEVAQ